MPAFKLNCPPVSISVAYKAGATPTASHSPKAWFVDVVLRQDNGSLKDAPGVSAPDLASAQKTAIETAKDFCVMHGVLPPDCLSGDPQWVEED